MLYIITGPINSYKTTKLKKLYESIGKGDGYISVKTMKNNKVLYYELERLSDKKKQLFIIHKNHYPNLFQHIEQIGPYVFDMDYLNEVTSYIKTLIQQDNEPIFLDEIGILETKKKCFYPILKELIQSDLDVYITIRESLVTTIISLLGVTDYTIVP